MKRTHLDLFSGIGGFALACRWAGVETIGFAEIDDYASRVLAKNFPGVPNYGDVRNVPGSATAWLVTGGFPCQPFSVAGKQGGASDDRWLWPEMAGVVKRTRPAWVLAENVPGIIRMELDTVLADLERLKYTAWPVVVPACAVDAPHRRERVWIVAYDDGGRSKWARTNSNESDAGANRRHNIGRCGAAVADAESAAIRPGLCQDEPGRERGRRSGDGGGTVDVSHSDNAGRPQQRQQIASQSQHAAAECCCRWEPEPDVGRVAHGIPNRVDRLKGLGNAIVPQVAYQLIQMMIAAEERA